MLPSWWKGKIRLAVMLPFRSHCLRFHNFFTLSIYMCVAVAASFSILYSSAVFQVYSHHRLLSVVVIANTQPRLHHKE